MGDAHARLFARRLMLRRRSSLVNSCRTRYFTKGKHNLVHLILPLPQSSRSLAKTRTRPDFNPYSSFSVCIRADQ